MNVPSIIYAGDTVKWNEPATGGYSSADSWVATFYLRHASGGEHFSSLTGVADGAGGWDFTITATQSALLDVNGHYWQVVVTKGTERFTLGTGELHVKPNLSALNNYDGRSQAQQDLESVQAAIRAIITGGAVAEYSIGSRSLKKMSMTDLLALESKLKADVAREQMAARGNAGRSLFVKFGVR